MSKLPLENSYRKDMTDSLMESRIRGNVYVRFGGEHLKTYHSNMERRWVLSLRTWYGFGIALTLSGNKNMTVFLSLWSIGFLCF